MFKSTETSVPADRHAWVNDLDSSSLGNKFWGSLGIKKLGMPVWMTWPHISYSVHSTSHTGGLKMMSVKMRKEKPSPPQLPSEGDLGRGPMCHWPQGTTATLSPLFFLLWSGPRSMPQGHWGPQKLAPPILAHNPTHTHRWQKRWCRWKVGQSDDYDETTGHEVPKGKQMDELN